MALRVIRAIRVHGKKVILNARTVGSRSGTTGAAAITYGDDQIIRAFIGRASSVPVPTELGNVTKTTRPIKTVTSFAKGDRLTLTDGTYYVRDTPTEIHSGHGDTERIVYESIIVRDPLA